MRTPHGLAIALLAASAAAVAAPASNLSVQFVQPETYVDAGYRSPIPGEEGRAEVQRDIEAHLRKLVERDLAANETLSIDVLDIDLAGSFEPLRNRGEDLRIVRNITVPKIKLRYTLSRGDQVVARAEEQVSDMNYLSGHNRYASGDRLRYEKAMLDNWFKQRIVQR